jgi:hypothetical protein
MKETNKLCSILAGALLFLAGSEIARPQVCGENENAKNTKDITEFIPGLANPRAKMPAVYTIPLVDLAGDKSRQVEVDRETNQYLGHPATALLDDGKTMLVVYPKGHGKGAIVMKKSEDGGLTWSERLTTPPNWSTSKETPTIFQTVDEKGAKRLLLFSGLYPVRESVSEDSGENWTPLAQVGDFGGIVAMSSMIRLNDNTYMALFHDDGRYLHNQGVPGNFQVFKTVSTDGGLTWSEPIAIAKHPAAQLCEPFAIRSPDGKQIAVLMRENSRRYNSFVMFSNDEGKSWSAPEELPAALTGDRHVGQYAPDGRLFIAFRDSSKKSPTKGDWVGWVGAYEDIVKGTEGQYRVRLMHNTKAEDCCYTGLVLLPDETFVATTYGHWEKDKQPYIMSVRFTMKEIDELSAKPGH